MGTTMCEAMELAHQKFDTALALHDGTHPLTGSLNEDVLLAVTVAALAKALCEGHAGAAATAEVLGWTELVHGVIAHHFGLERTNWPVSCSCSGWSDARRPWRELDQQRDVIENLRRGRLGTWQPVDRDGKPMTNRRGPHRPPTTGVVVPPAVTTMSTPASPVAGGTNPLGELMALLQRPAGEQTVVCVRPVDGEFRPIWGRADQWAVSEIPQDVDVWWGPQVYRSGIHPQSKGYAKDVTAIVVLAPDLDIKPGGFAHAEDAEKCISLVADRLGVQPVAVVGTGHGIQGYWRVDAAGSRTRTNLDLQALMLRFGRLVAQAATEFAGLAKDGTIIPAAPAGAGAQVDSVFNLDRVLRCPGSVNVGKGAAVPTTLEVWDADDWISLDELEERLTAWGVAELPTDRKVVGAAVTSRDDWTFASETDRYVAGMIRGWQSDVGTKGGSRNPWMFSSLIRLECARAVGAVTRADYDQAVRIIERRFNWLLENTEPKRRPAASEFSGAQERAVAMAESKSYLDCWKELGGDPPQTTNPFGMRYVGGDGRLVLPGATPATPRSSGAPAGEVPAAPVVRPLAVVAGVAACRWLGDSENRIRTAVGAASAAGGGVALRVAALALAVAFREGHLGAWELASELGLDSSIRSIVDDPAVAARVPWLPVGGCTC